MSTVDDSAVLCLCPEGRDNSCCFHVRFLREYASQQFPPDERMSGKIPLAIGFDEHLNNLVENNNQTFLFSRTEHHVDDHYINLFSVFPQSPYPSIKNRVVVEHIGDDNGNGSWRCFKDSRATHCIHIVDARHSLQRYLHGDPNARDPNVLKADLGMLSKFDDTSLIRYLL